MSLVGKAAPLFVEEAAFNEEFVTLNLESYRGKWVVLFFYPLDFTFVCPTEITAMSDAFEEFKKRGVEVIGGSTDSKFSHNAWLGISREDGGLGNLKFPLLADYNKRIATDYGILNEDGVALRATFIIDPEGVVQFELIHNLGIGRNVNEIIRNVDALQFHKEHGEVCPAGWTPGGDTIIPDLEECKKYFSKASH